MSTPVQKVSAVLGVVFLVIGVLGLVMGGTGITSSIPLLGLFHVNLVHNIVHLGFGGWALAASRSEKMAESYAQIAGVIYVALALLGLFAPSGFGLVPLGDHNIWLHALIGLALLYFGFGSSLTEENLKLE